MIFKRISTKMNIKLTGWMMAGLMLFAAVSCSSGPAQSPEDFIKAFIKKQISMIDLSMVNYYVKDEQPGIREMITRTIETKKAEGVIDSLKNAKYDLSNLKVKMVKQNEQYVNDEPVSFVKMEAKGSYTVSMDGKQKTFLENEVFVLQEVGNEWKITERLNPWK